MSGNRIQVLPLAQSMPMVLAPQPLHGFTSELMPSVKLPESSLRSHYFLQNSRETSAFPDTEMIAKYKYIKLLLRLTEHAISFDPEIPS